MCALNNLNFVLTHRFSSPTFFVRLEKEFDPSSLTWIHAVEFCSQMHAPYYRITVYTAYAYTRHIYVCMPLKEKKTGI